MEDGVTVTSMGAYSRRCPEDRAVVIAGPGWHPGDRRLGVIVCHSAGQLAAEQADPEWWPVPRALAASGQFVCVACDFGDPDVPAGPTSGRFSWGNDLALALMDDAWEFLASDRIGADTSAVVLAATSMGALSALGWALRRPERVACVVLGCPVLDLQELYLADRGGLAASISAAYGVGPGAALPGMAHHDPSLFAAELRGLPVRIYASSDDSLASDAASCRRWADAVGGEAVSMVDLGPCGHWPRGTPTVDALDFVRGLVPGPPS